MSRLPKTPVRSLLILVGIIAAVLTASDAWALPKVQKYISVTVTPSELDLGDVSEPSVFDSSGELKVHVAANCNHGSVVVSVTHLVRAEGGSIGPERVSVRLPATNNYVPLANPVSVTNPVGPGIFDVVLKFRVQTILADVPGTYAGQISITCSVAP